MNFKMPWLHSAQDEDQRNPREKRTEAGKSSRTIKEVVANQVRNESSLTVKEERHCNHRGGGGEDAGQGGHLKPTHGGGKDSFEGSKKGRSGEKGKKKQKSIHVLRRRKAAGLKGQAVTGGGLHCPEKGKIQTQIEGKNEARRGKVEWEFKARQKWNTLSSNRKKIANLWQEAFPINPLGQPKGSLQSKRGERGSRRSRL